MRCWQARRWQPIVSSTAPRCHARGPWALQHQHQHQHNQPPCRSVHTMACCSAQQPYKQSTSFPSRQHLWRRSCPLAQRHSRLPKRLVRAHDRRVPLTPWTLPPFLASTNDPDSLAQDLSDAINRMLAPIISHALNALGATDTWQVYLLYRFMQEAVLPAVAAMVLYRIVTSLANAGLQYLDATGAPSSADRAMYSSAPSAVKTAVTASATSTTSTTSTTTSAAPASSGTKTSSSSSGGKAGSSGSAGQGMPPGGLLRLVPLALTGGPARAFFKLVLAVHISRNVATILDDFIRKYNPKLPYSWLDNAVHLMGESLTPLDSFLTKLSLAGSTLFACAVLLRCKDMAVAWFVKHHVEAIDPSHEIVANFINPAANLSNLLIIVGTAVWLACHLGINLQPLLAVGGASGIIIGLGTQQILGNFVSGLNIFLARPFVAGEYISILGPNFQPSQVSGKVVRVDPMRTLLATEDHATIAVPNKLIADCVVVNRSRTPHWTVGSASPVLANPRELRFRMKLPHDALPNLKALTSDLEVALERCLPNRLVRHSDILMEVVRFTEQGAELVVKCNLAWRVRRDPLGEPLLSRELHARQEQREALLQKALIELHGVVREAGGMFVAGQGWTKE